MGGKGVKWNGDNNVEHMWDHVKRAMVESAREVCGSVRVRKKPKECVMGLRDKIWSKEKGGCLEGGVGS